ncbi:response regulator [Desulfovibrio sp. OttesenSCG-928-I05]|nr:response regulator [Desulfovibrio sp. OttesenSCG-928-I05]
MKKNTGPNRVTFFFFASFIVVLVIALSARQMMLDSAEIIEIGTKQEMAALSMAASLLVSAEELDAFSSIEDMQTPEYIALKKKLDAFTKNAGIQFSYFMRLDPVTNKMQFIIDNVLDPAEDADGLDSPQVAREAGPDTALTGKQYVASLGSYSDGWDGLLTAWSPMYYKDGTLSNTVAGVDMQDVFIKRNLANAQVLSTILILSLLVVVILSFVSMTLYRRKARQATLASEAKSSFLSRMSHEMRTPLNAIIGLSAMASEADHFDTAKRHLENITISSRHLRSLIDDILDISKIESGKMLLESTLVNVENELDTIKSIIVPQTNAKQQAFTLHVDPAIPANLYYDTVHLRQVVVNLLSNAIKFTPENGSITLSVILLEKHGDECNLEWRVQDTGIGIDKSKLHTLFAPFEQADVSTTRKYGGTGLGLTISRQLVEMMRGTIRVESEPGAGSTFIFNTWVNIAPDDATFEAEPRLDAGSRLDLSGKHLLLVEDAAINQMLAVELLERYGAHVDVAENGQEGFDMFMAAPERYAIIFMDIQMPVMDGYTSTRMIRASAAKEAQSVPIVAMTANVFKEDKDRAFASGMNAHLKKPFEVEQIEATIASLLPEAVVRT